MTLFHFSFGKFRPCFKTNPLSLKKGLKKRMGFPMIKVKTFLKEEER
jgi:hypothetical protein